jgi:Ca-activated chloride channel family protein
MSLLAALLLLAAGAPQEPLVFRAEVGVVRVEVLVTRKGVPVHGLSAADFELRDDGRPQELQPVLDDESPVDAVLVLDSSGSVKGPKLDGLMSAARAFLESLHAGEQAAVLAFREEVQLLQPFTPDLGAARKALERASPLGNTALVDAVYAALRLREPGPRRTAILVFSDGVDTLSWLGRDEVVEAASRSDAIVYGVALRKPGGGREAFLADVCRRTGGRLFEIEHERDLRARFLDVLADIRARYVLSFSPAAGAAGWHALQVRLRRLKGDVLTRPGYWRSHPSR